MFRIFKEHTKRLGQFVVFLDERLIVHRFPFSVRNVKNFFGRNRILFGPEKFETFELRSVTTYRQNIDRNKTFRKKFFGRDLMNFAPSLVCSYTVFLTFRTESG